MYWFHSSVVIGSPATEQIQAITRSRSVSQMRVVVSAPAAASMAPSGLNASVYCASPGRMRVAMVVGARGLLTSYSQTVLSVAAAANVRPSGLNATQ